jgi:multicomponent Na+:H+ antiporter subunit F
MSYQDLVYKLLSFCIFVLSICTLACLFRAIKGPSIADRLIAVNITDTQVVALICLLAARSGEYGFADIAIIYALFSFLAVAILTRFLAGRRKP